MAKQQTPKQPKNQGFRLPPFLSYDPSIDAERRAQQRGLKDILKDTSRAQRYAREDLTQKQADIGRSQARGLEDIGRTYSQGAEDISTRQARGMEDFNTQLTNLIRGFQQKGQQQTQTANAAGVLDPSTQAASAARRAENLAVARQPIDTGIARLGEDTARSFSRLTGSTQLATSRLGEDTTRDYGLAKQDYQRTGLDLTTKLRRAKREQQIGNLDLIQQAIFNARQNKPGAFDQYGNRKKGKRK